jgi:3-dehydroquinate synthase
VKKINVNFGSGESISSESFLSQSSYPIYIGNNLALADLLPSYLNSDVLIITNETLAPLYLEKLHKALEFLSSNNLNNKNNKRKVISCVISDGEKYKSLESFTQIMEVLLKENFHRDATLIALGGGVIGDLTGFVAATFMRGVSFIQIPTSLLAQVDASIGGKTGVNHPLGKNMIGAFYQPKAVFIDVDFLGTLPDEQFVSGMAEVVKHALIADADFFEFLIKNQKEILNRNGGVLSEMIFYSCKIKSKIVMEDEREKGRRALLNFGHTLGHAIEKCSDYKILHGHAVAMGMAFALKVSCQWAKLSEEQSRKSLELLRAFNLPTEVPNLLIDDLWSAMKLDKKHDGNSWKYILLKKIGDAIIYSIDENKDENRNARGADSLYLRSALEEMLNLSRSFALS